MRGIPVHSDQIPAHSTRKCITIILQIAGSWCGCIRMTRHKRAPSLSRCPTTAIRSAFGTNGRFPRMSTVQHQMLPGRTIRVLATTSKHSISPTINLDSTTAATRASAFALWRRLSSMQTLPVQFRGPISGVCATIMVMMCSAHGQRWCIQVRTNTISWGNQTLLAGHTLPCIA